MFKKIILLFAMLFSVAAHATTVTFNRSGTDQPGAAANKTVILDLPSQSTAFNFSGTLDLSNVAQPDGNPGLTFGLYLNTPTLTLKKAITDFTYNPTGDIYTFNFSGLAAGNYSLRFNVTTGGTYSLASSISPVTVTPVPEPSSSALMLFGLSALVFIARKKSA